MVRLGRPNCLQLEKSSEIFYDDSYCIRYAQSHGGYVVTNDMYRDHVKGQVARVYVCIYSI